MLKVYRGRGRLCIKTVTDFGIDTAEIQVLFQGEHCLSIGINWGLPEGTPGYCQELINGPLGMVYSVDDAHPDRFLGDISQTTGVALKGADGTTLIECAQGGNGPETCIDDLVESIESDIHLSSLAVKVGPHWSWFWRHLSLLKQVIRLD